MIFLLSLYQSWRWYTLFVYFRNHLGVMKHSLWYYQRETGVVTLETKYIEKGIDI